MAQLLDVFGFLAVILRGLTLSFQSLVVGGIVFVLVVAAVLRTVHSDEYEAVRRSNTRMIGWFALALSLTQMIYVYVDSAILMGTTGLPIGEIAGAGFFVAGCATIAGAILIAIVCLFSPRVNVAWLSPLALIVLASSLTTSHSMARMEWRLPLAGLTELHHLSTAAWVGGLPFLIVGLRRCGDSSAKDLVSRFSTLAFISVVVLFSAGAAMSLVYVGSWTAVYGTAYGVMVAAKVALFGLLLILGAMNFLIVRGVRGDGGALLRQLRAFGEAEIGIGFTVILAAASLTSQPPAADLSVGRVSMAEIVARETPRWPTLNSPDLSTLSTSQLADPPSAQDAANPLEALVPGEQYQPRNAADIAWSEYNHHWAGLVVLLIGVLAVLERTGYAPWARNWPLAFLILAVFLFLRADPENWPLGKQGFWESFKYAEVLQHRLFVALICAFAFFEWGVRTGRLTAARAAMVFPMVCALGGALLLTHSHSLTNVKEELLAELSHVPLAIFGVTAGWARWLEIRLDKPYRAIPASIWPVCFVMVAAVLLMYRES